MSELPLGWAEVALSDIGHWRGGGTPSKAKPEFWKNGTIPWVSPKDMKVSKIASAQDRITEDAVKGSATNLVEAGSVLLVTRSGILSHSLPVAINIVPVALNQDIKAVTPFPNTDADFLRLTFECFERQILNECRKGGTTVHSIEFPALQAFTIPLPPLDEQKRIVAKIEELFSELDAGEESLRRARRQLGVYRQSLLKQAFEGRLTAPWRTQNPDKLESPAQLLARIQAERKARYEQQFNEWKIALKESESNDEKKPPKPAILKPVSGSIPIFETPFPPEWNSLNLSQIALELGQGWSPKCLNYAADATQWGVMKTTAIQPGRFQSKASKALPSNFSPRPWLGLRHNDILITRAGPRSRCGVVCRVVGDHPKLLLCDKAYRLAFAQEVTSSEFIELLLCSPVASDAIEKLKTGINDSGVNITQTIFLQLVVPVPSLPEQQEIVRLLDEQFTVIEQNEQEIDTALKRSEALRQSILKKAFTGQLVPQDPADEPASELLARIREKRERGEKKKPTRRKRK